MNELEVLFHSWICVGGLASSCMVRLVGAGDALLYLGHLPSSTFPPSLSFICLPLPCLVLTGYFGFSVSETCRLLLFLEMSPLLV